MNPFLSELQPYPFEKLSKLFADLKPPADVKPISLSVGEPKHKAPAFIAEEITNNIAGFSTYPATQGSDALRQAIASWLIKRFHLPAGSIDANQNVLPVNGTREALFAFAHFIVDSGKDALVLMPNPFYQIYEGAALLAGAKPYYINATAENNFVPDFDSVPDSIWKKCQLLYLCSPGNPTGAVIDAQTIEKLIALSDRHNFVIASDECYSEIYLDENKPPLGLLQVAAQIGRNDFRNLMVFHSLSKRSSVPGMRSGFVAGDSSLINKFRLYRTYHGCAMPPPIQAASTKAWSDEAHVLANRDLYRAKFAAVLEILQPAMNVHAPDASFYLWPETPIDDCEFARLLFERYNVTVLPGSYLSRQSNGINPGHKRLRLALVASVDECVEAAKRIRQLVQEIKSPAAASANK
jgi:N-succinyldiaminopimelate aminotransferase